MFVTSQNTNVKIITSSDSIPIDHHFKVIAGPGAGKTYWLVNHIKGVLRQSKKLTRSGKIACITYTNVASEEIVRRLGDCGNSVDASTIHSFLYRNVIKPYSFLLGAEGLFNPLELNGHDDHIPNMGLVSKWKSQTEQYYLKDDSAVCKCLSELDWFFDKSDTLKLKPRNPWRQKIGKYSIRNDSFIEYKKICWNKGFLHHEDVLYFSYNLISKNPRILEFIRVRFPYIFIDEFQDTHPIQAKIISLIGRESTLVGIIGDPCQSIYKFQGASRKHFLDFKLPGIQEYKIIINRRSAANIVNFLNHFRDQELIQEIHHIGEENSVIVFVGDPIEVVKNISNSKAPFTILSRRNDVIQKLKHNVSQVKLDIWDDLYRIDGDFNRPNSLRKILTALLDIEHNNIKISLTRISSVLKYFDNGSRIPSDDKIRISRRILERLYFEREAWLDKTIIEGYNQIKDFISKEFSINIGPRISKGKIKEFSASYTINDLFLSLTPDKNSSCFHTIHKAKGLEFENVLLVLDDAKEVNHLLQPSINSEEDDTRIYYVAMSRAINQLCIAIRSLENEQANVFQEKYACEIRIL